jgi:8-oxo-dGTP diphosphatase
VGLSPAAEHGGISLAQADSVSKPGRRDGGTGPPHGAEGDRVTQGDATDLTEGRAACESRNCLLASALLVDSRGWLLLQERDDAAPVSPNQWGLVGGHVEPGEDWEVALHREIAEETGLVLDDGLELWFDEVVQHSPKVSTHLADRWRIWVGKVDLSDDDIVLGEGRQIVFVDPARVSDGSLELASGAAYVLSRFLQSETYQALL